MWGKEERRNESARSGPFRRSFGRSGGVGLPIFEGEGLPGEGGGTGTEATEQPLILPFSVISVSVMGKGNLGPAPSLFPFSSSLPTPARRSPHPFPGLIALLRGLRHLRTSVPERKPAHSNNSCPTQRSASFHDLHHEWAFIRVHSRAFAVSPYAELPDEESRYDRCLKITPNPHPRCW